MNSTVKKTYLQYFLIIALMITIRFIPTFGEITDYGMQVLGIFIGCIVGWSLGYQYFTSISALILLSFCGENTFNSIFSGAFGHTNIIMVFFAFLFCNGISQTGLVNYIANWILSKKFASKGPWMISLAFWIASAVCAAIITNGLPIFILLWTMFYEIVEKLGVSKNEKWVPITIIMIVVIGAFSSVSMPYAGWNLMLFGLAQSSDPSFSINLFAHTLLISILTILVTASVYFLCKYLLGRDMKNFEIDSSVINISKNKMTKQQQFGAFYLLILALMLFLPNVLPPTVPGISIFSGLTTTGCFAVMTLLLCVTHVDGKPLMDPIQSTKQMPWGLMYLLVAAMFMAGLIANPNTGIGATILSVLNASVGQLGLFAVVVAFVVLGCIVTNAINNVVCANIFVPIGVGMIVAMGGDPHVLTSLLCPILYLGLLLPSGSASGALLHGNTEWLKPQDIYKYASIGCCICIFWCVIVGIPLGNFLYGM